MTTAAAVEFHTGIAQPVGHACGLLRRLHAEAAGAVLVTAPPPLLAELDRALWTVLEREFVAHGVVDGGDGAGVPLTPAMAARTPVWLARSAVLPAALPPRTHAVWVNLGADGPAAAAPRVVEIVADEADAAAAARERWRRYKQQGCTVEHLPGGRRAG